MDLPLLDEDDQLIEKIRIKPETRKRLQKGESKASFLGKKSTKPVLQEISDQSESEEDTPKEKAGRKEADDAISDITTEYLSKRPPN